MSIWNALYAGVSGLYTHGTELGVLGDNIANANTVGFKRGRAVFGDMLSTFVPTTNGAAQMGRGSVIMKIEQEFNQGAALHTENPLDLSIVGNGFFVVRGTQSGVTGDFYTRAGNFRLDRDGFLTNPSGLRVQGYAKIPQGTTSQSRSLGDLRLGGITVRPELTQNIEVTAALNPNDTVHPAFDVLSPAETSSFTSTLTMYDALGQPHQVEVYANRLPVGDPRGDWEWHVLARSDEISPNNVPPPAGQGDFTTIATGTLEFDADGRLESVTTARNSVLWNNVDQEPGVAGIAQALNFDWGDPTDTGGSGLLGTTQFSSQPSTIVYQQQDGSPTGVLQSLVVDESGNITGSFTNGTSKVLGQVAMASFVNPRGMARLGGNLWATTPESGDPATGFPNSDGRGSILSQSLEQSNVDMAREFVNLIRTQRAYQANSKTITTADQLMESAMSLKR